VPAERNQPGPNSGETPSIGGVDGTLQLRNTAEPESLSAQTHGRSAPHWPREGNFAWQSEGEGGLLILLGREELGPRTFYFIGGSFVGGGGGAVGGGGWNVLLLDLLGKGGVGSCGEKGE